MTGLNNESNTPELASLNRIKDIAQKEHNTVKNDDLAHEATREYQAKNDRYKSDTLDRKWLAEWSSTVVTIWLAGVLFILCSNTACFKLSDEEKISFKKAAKLSGMGFSAWARLRMREAAKKELLDAGQKVDFLTQKTQSNVES